MMPNARYWLISNERVRDYGCDSVRAAAEYFSKSCAPGVRLTMMQTSDLKIFIYKDTIAALFANRVLPPGILNT